MESRKCDPQNETQKLRTHNRAQGPQTNQHTRFARIFTCLQPPPTPRPKPNTRYKRVPHTHFWGVWIQIKPPETTTHPNGHPSVHKPSTKHTTGVQIGTTHPLRRVCGDIRLLSFVKTRLTSTTGEPQYAQPPKPKGPAPRNDDRRTCVPHTRFGRCCYIRFLPPVKTHLTSTRVSPQGGLPPNTAIDETAYHTPTAAGPSPSAKTPAQRNPIQEPAITVQKTSTTHPLQQFVIWTNTRDPPNEHGRTTTHPPNESREWQRVKTMMQARDEPHTCRSGVVIFKVFF
ncbi:hypothetical protein BS47DRAFT_1368977 [Hydnum rufescens UP504]|uniref:Uncharacterized protein n=1 Tax=Hydnum rufescens UP504 TaxID=1448309 RepID=A0A9P6AE47_9AGAM|nr:hypothetical protein BS47DRAFT_1368977 [Hydnum rufescens UP504]